MAPPAVRSYVEYPLVDPGGCPTPGATARPTRFRGTSMPSPRCRSLVPLALFLVIGAGCMPQRASTGVSPWERTVREDGQAPGGLILTQDDIAKMGVRDAFHAVERAKTHLRIQRTREGTPEKITHRGVSSFLLSPEILVVVDGARVQTVVQHLRSIPAESILYIQILNGREASAQYGSEAGNGVILVRTAAMATAVAR